MELTTLWEQPSRYTVDLDRGCWNLRTRCVWVGNYRGLRLDCGYRLDLVIERSIIVEVEAIRKVLPVHRAQVLTYLKLTNYRLGLLINFNVELLRSGLYRIING
jgi:GxxExxY protein